MNIFQDAFQKRSVSFSTDTALPKQNTAMPVSIEKLRDKVEFSIVEDLARNTNQP
jgi:hypothetical protein